MDKEAGYCAAVAEAKAGADEGGVPIGACLVSRHGKILGKGRNMRVQKGSATLHVGLLNAYNTLVAALTALCCKGRDVRLGGYRQTPSSCLRGGDHVHISFTM